MDITYEKIKNKLGFDPLFPPEREKNESMETNDSAPSIWAPLNEQELAYVIKLRSGLDGGLKVENSNFKEYFNEEMTSEEALDVFVKLLRSVPKEQRDALYEAYAAVDDAILRRKCEKVKEGWMY